jgi:aldose sugar dehydrogenase
MRRVLRVTTTLTIIALAGCGGNNNPPPSSQPPPGGGNTITGRERIGWAQTASPADLSTYRYALYVDGTRRVLEGETCGPTADAATYDCSAPLPTMTAGAHTLELASFFTQGDTVYESARSSPLRVVVTAVSAPVPSNDIEGGTLISSDGLRLQADIIARDLNDPVDVAISPEGQIFIAERGRRVRMIDLQSGISSRGDDMLRLPGQPDDARIASVALAPDFPRTRAVFVAYQEIERTEPVIRVARFSENMGVLAQAAVIASEPIAPEASAIVRFGPDGALYVGIGSGSAPDSAQSAASASGKILRLRDDGTTPNDNPSGSPIFSAGHRDPRGLVWDAGNGALWEIERDESGDEINVIRAGANYGSPVVTGSRGYARMIPAALVLPAGTQSSGMTTVTSPASPLFGALIVSTAGAEDILRIDVGTGRYRRPVGRLLQGRFGRIGPVAATSDGAIYLITANKEIWGDGHDLLVRLTVAERTRQ